MNAAGSPEATAAKKRSLLRRVPTTLIVTLLGIGLSAWLIPAFTRQWDDRQKAHELKATIVAEMASATADALTEAHDMMVQSSYHDLGLAKSPLPPVLTDSSWQVTPAVEKVWARRSIRIEAQLRAYFGGGQANEWRGYRHVVDRFLAHAAGQPFGPQADPHPAPLPADLAKLNDDVWALVQRRSHVVDQLNKKLHGTNAAVAQQLLSIAVVLATIQDGLLAYEEKLGREVLRSHVDGFSTTTHDLLTDLLP